MMESVTENYYVTDDGLPRFLAYDRRMKLVKYYTNPKSRTFGNGYRSAKRAGYSDSFARVITIRLLRKRRLTKLIEDARDFDFKKKKVEFRLSSQSVGKSYPNLLNRNK